MSEHPCPTPRKQRNDRDGDMWACPCGRVYVLRNDRNWAGDVWHWAPTGLNARFGLSEKGAS